MKDRFLFLGELMRKHIVCFGDSNTHGYCADPADCAFMDAEGVAEFNKVDYMHLTAKGHSQLAEALSKKIIEILP